MTGRWEGTRDVLVGIDPERGRHLVLAWAADEAHLRHPPLRLVPAVPPQHDTHHVDGPSRQTPWGGPVPRDSNRPATGSAHAVPSRP